MAVEIAAEPIPLKLDEYGTWRVGGTRVTLETLVAAFDRGETAEEIAGAFSTLRLDDIYAVITYYLRHREDVEAYIREQDRQGAVIRKMLEAVQGDQRGLRERLLARRAQQQTS